MNNAEYYAQRERDERQLAELATDAEVRQIHLTLAEAYSRLAREEAIGSMDFDSAQPKVAQGR